MIESMSAAIAGNLDELLNARQPTHKASWSATCLADFGDDGVAFIAQPQIPPRNVNWSAEGRVGSLYQGGLRKVLPAQDTSGTH
jgi:sulfide:quinone oxidoreductase